ncbi:GGDEF domain-containing protein [Shewanella sp. NIFS-20-20]|uniref:GGDEF domain-containing protein n=1 Tax=Shewanella sp. NIFS-20-20 TaxID=2853806 RepID=UPI001C455153|nr:GGDEF domain-containing protein [Shewanella sp. NIFS-20-20]MBV7316145.1 GGDEF domain-containing protein [Shewanella sp. NIFS-20-20]
MHRLLKRQLKKVFPQGLADDPQLALLIDLVDQAYHDFTEEQMIIERSLDLSSNELNTKNANLNALLNAMPDTYLWLDKHDRVIDIRLGQALSGIFTPHQHHQTLTDAIYNGDMSGLSQHLSGVRSGCKPNLYEFSLTRHGDELFIETRFAHLRGQQVLLIFRDITVRKLLDNYMAQALDESKRTLQQLQDVINLAPIGFAITTLDNQVLMLNDYAMEKFNLDSTQVLPDDFSQLIANKHRPRYQECLMPFQTKIQATSTKNRIDVDICPEDAPCFTSEIAISNLVLEGKSIIIQTFLDISERKHLEGQLRRLAQTDSLTGCFNRGHFNSIATTNLANCQELQQPFSLLAMDLDKFKGINDTYGHAGGDAVLIAFCERTQQQLRQEDVFGRFGGEEFIVALSNTNHKDAKDIAERIRQHFSVEPIIHAQQTIHASVSIGLITSNGSKDTLEDLLKQADEYLYLAKNNGRNQVYS